jgi:hypothetical protein
MEVIMKRVFKNILLASLACFASFSVVDAMSIILENQMGEPLYIDNIKTKGSLVINSANLVGSCLSQGERCSVKIEIFSPDCRFEENFIEISVFDKTSETYKPFRVMWNRISLSDNHRDEETSYILTRQSNGRSSIVYTILDGSDSVISRLKATALQQLINGKTSQQKLGSDKRLFGHIQDGISDDSSEDSMSAVEDNATSLLPIAIDFPYFIGNTPSKDPSQWPEALSNISSNVAFLLLDEHYCNLPTAYSTIFGLSSYAFGNFAQFCMSEFCDQVSRFIVHDILCLISLIMVEQQLIVNDIKSMLDNRKLLSLPIVTLDDRQLFYKIAMTVRLFMAE